MKTAVEFPGNFWKKFYSSVKTLRVNIETYTVLYSDTIRQKSTQILLWEIKS